MNTPSNFRNLQNCQLPILIQIEFFSILFKILSFYSSNFKISKNALGQLTLNCCPKHVISSTNEKIPLTYAFLVF